MTTIGIAGCAYLVLLSALTVLSVRTLATLRGFAPWTSAGWLATIGYDAAASYEIVAHRHLPGHTPYWFLAALTAAFIAAGIRDEPQGEPWWWPSRLSATRAQKRAS